MAYAGLSWPPSMLSMSGNPPSLLGSGNLRCPAGEVHLSGNKPAQLCASKQELQAKLFLPFSTIRIRLWQILLAPRMPHDRSPQNKGRDSAKMERACFNPSKSISLLIFGAHLEDISKHHGFDLSHLPQAAP